tara:strand:- start:6535 stop:7887 length:1353 start_codon:yes stop_codon:yes gene_type:complete
MAATAAALAVEEEPPIPKFEFDEAFQSKIAALACRDTMFLEQTEGLVHPDHFENAAEATLVNISLEYFQNYKQVPDTVILLDLVRAAIKRKAIRSDMVAEVKASIRGMLKANIADRKYVEDKISDFARHQAMGDFIIKAVEWREKNDFNKIDEELKKVMNVGINEMTGAYDYWEKIEQRTHIRREEAAGRLKKRGITTGIRALDKVLYHHGWGRKEMAVIMGGPKTGKSTALGTFAKNASLAGHNVIVFSLEVSNDIIAERLDASMSDIAVNALGKHIVEVDSKIKIAGKKAGHLKMHEFPTGTLTPSALKRIITRYKSQGIVFDLCVVDYGDIMAPNFRTMNEIENSKSIYVDLRACAQEEDFAMLTATQTNRDGAKARVAKMEHVAEDFNRIRIADLVISINADEAEKEKNEARLYFTASRNQKGNFTLRIQQDLERMIFVKKVLGME